MFVADQHIAVSDPTEMEMEMMRDKMQLFIFPNRPNCAEQRAAFDKACQYQIAHEKTELERMNQQTLPAGTTGFQIGDFRMDFDGNAVTDALTRKNVCPAAYSVLLVAGLLYKGVERPC